MVTWIISLYSAFLNSNAVNLGKTGHGLIIKRCIWKERKTTKNLHNIKLKEKCGHRHKQNTIHIQWKIEGSLNARVNEGIIRMNSRRFSGFNSPSLLGQQKKLHIFVSCSCFVHYPLKSPKQTANNPSPPDTRHSLAIMKVPLVKNALVYFCAF